MQWVVISYRLSCQHRNSCVQCYLALSKDTIGLSIWLLFSLPVSSSILQHQQFQLPSLKSQRNLLSKNDGTTKGMMRFLFLHPILHPAPTIVTNIIAVLTGPASLTVRRLQKPRVQNVYGFLLKSVDCKKTTVKSSFNLDTILVDPIPSHSHRCLYQTPAQVVSGIPARPNSETSAMPASIFCHVLVDFLVSYVTGASEVPFVSIGTMHVLSSLKASQNPEFQKLYFSRAKSIFISRCSLPCS